ncbi:MAG: hypothetical protein Q8Q46_01790 [Candidatus Giovannonibacteria bacterium]|nr:hypothetical protein [Candidatus Giovannonibacteria bacterium]
MEANDEVKNLLKKNLEVGEESLKVLRKIHRDVWWRRFFGFAKFAVIAGLLIFSYLKLEPLLNNLLNTYDKLLNPVAPQNVNLNVGVKPVLPPEIKNLIDGFLNTR